MINRPLSILLGFILVWVALDVGGGAMHGISEAKKRQFDETPLIVFLQQAVANHKAYVGSSWAEQATIESVKITSAGVSFRLTLANRVEASIGSRLTQAKRADIRNAIRSEVCRYDDLRYVLARGGEVYFAVSKSDGEKLFDVNASRGSC